jgi:release factor glutamine methyltransferase
MPIKELYRQYLQQLQGLYGLQEATVMTDRVFESTASISRSEVIKNPFRQLDSDTTQNLAHCFSQLLQHRPLQYVLGETWFQHLRFKVDERVLIPRPETEELVHLILNDKRSLHVDLSILDIGTGSGCIAVSLKKNLPACTVTAIDKSEPALEVARDNAEFHHTTIRFLKMDILDEQQWKNLPVFDIMASNPPYIPLHEKEKMPKNVVQHEPHLALFVENEDPLVFYKKIAALGMKHLGGNGKIYLETHENHAQEVKALFSSGPYTAEVLQDASGKERMLRVTT